LHNLKFTIATEQTNIYIIKTEMNSKL